MTTVTRRLEFDAGHRVLGHQGRCRHLHGHRYRVDLTVQAPELNSLGMVIDFAVLKRDVGGWIDAVLDHNLLLNKDDPQALHLVDTEDRRPWLMIGNPTAENIAALLFEKAVELLPPEMT